MKKVHSKLKAEAIDPAKRFKSLKRTSFLSKQEFSRAVALAEDEDIDLNIVGFIRDDDHSWSAFAEIFKSNSATIQCTVFQLARVVSYNCLDMNGMLDTLEAAKIWDRRTQIFIIGSGSDEAISMRHQRTYYRDYLERHEEGEKNERSKL